MWCGSFPPEGHGTGAASIRCRESIVLSRREQVAALLVVSPVKFQEPLFGHCMRLDRAVVQDVADSQAVRGDAPGHQEAAMTVERLALGAHDTDA